MKRILYYIIFLGLLSSCGEDSVVEPLDHSPNTNANPTIAELAMKNAPEPRIVELYNEKGGLFYAPKGTILTFAPNTYGSVKGSITLKIYEVYNKRNMVGSGVYTETEDGRMLNSQGMFRVLAYYQGALIQPVLDVDITMPVAAGSTPANTKLFELVESVDTNRMQMVGKWKESSNTWSADSSQNGRAKFKISLLNWCNLDAYIAGGTNNRILLSVPDGFTNKNTSVYFNLDGVNGVTQLGTDPVNKQFYTLNINQGLSGTLVLVALKDNIYYKKVIQVSFTGSEQTINLDVLEPSYKGEIEAILAGM
ncbi:MAG: hypothetical protein R2852_03450 [Bacteroidia bacterium]